MTEETKWSIEKNKDTCMFCIHLNGHSVIKNYCQRDNISMLRSQNLNCATN